MAQHICRDAVEIHWANGNIQVIRPVRGSVLMVKRRAEYVPLLGYSCFCRSADGRIICSEGYAHALYQLTCPVPVDSKLERNTLTALLNAASWLKRKPCTPELSLGKALFDTEVYVNGEKKYVLPDFIVTARVLTERRPEWSSKRWDMKTVITARENPAAYRHEADWCSAYRSTEMADNEHPPPFKKHMYGAFYASQVLRYFCGSVSTFPVTLSVVTGKSGFCIAPENTQTVMLPQRQQAF